MKDFIFSNFDRLDVPIREQGIEYWTVENFYQAMKVPQQHVELRKRISEMTPGGAKKAIHSGRYPIRDDWQDVKLDVMMFALRLKFKRGTLWSNQLIATLDTELVEFNTWHDCWWGWCVCMDCANKHKLNHLGRLLMSIRKELVDGN